MKKNPSKPQHESYGKAALRNAEAYLQDARRGDSLDQIVGEAIYAVIEGTRAYWNAYDAGDKTTAKKATKVVADAQSLVMAAVGEDLGTRQKGEGLEWELFHTYRLDTKTNPSNARLTKLRKQLPPGVKIKYDRDYGEYQVRYKDATYFTNDEEDALNTAKHMATYGNPYVGDAVQDAKRRKYGYPKPPAPKSHKNPAKKATKKPTKRSGASIARRALS